MNSIKRKIRTAIRKAKITQRELSRRIGISEQMLSYYLNPDGKADIPEHILEQVKNIVQLKVEEEDTRSINHDAETITAYMNLNVNNKEVIRELIQILLSKQKT